jgi:branched-chain amino acid transport system permease protein
MLRAIRWAASANSRWIGFAIVATVATAAFFVPEILGGDQYRIGVWTLALLFAVWATGWNVVSGFAGQFSIGHSAFVGCGAYASVLLFTTYGLSPWIGMAVAGAVAALVGILIGVPAFRLRGPYFALTTIAFAEVVRLAVSTTDSLGPFDVGGARGVLVPIGEESLLTLQFADKASYYRLTLGLLIVVLVLSWWLNRSKMGRYWAAVRTDQEAAASLGVPVLRYKTIAAAISGGIVGIGGGLYAHYVGFVDPNRAFGLDLSIQIALMGLIGGRATVLGPAIGALVLYPVGEAARAQLGATSGAHLAVFGLALVLAIYFLPRGIVGVRLRRRRAAAVEDPRGLPRAA